MKWWHYVLLCITCSSIGASLLLPIFNKKSLLEQWADDISTKEDTYTAVGGDPQNSTLIYVVNETVQNDNGFSIQIFCEPKQPMVAYEFDVEFDKSIIQANDVSPGTIFSGFNTLFNAGNIDNSNGIINNIYELIVPTSQGNVTESGSLVFINFTPIVDDGVSYINLLNVGLTNETVYIPIYVINGSAIIQSAYGGNIAGNSVWWENKYGRLEVFPHTSNNICSQTQYANVTWKYPDNTIDIAFRFKNNLSYGKVFLWSNISHDVIVYDYGWKYSNYTLVDISNFTLIDEPDYVDFGDIPSLRYAVGDASYWDVESDEWINKTFYIGFDNFTWLNPEHTSCYFDFVYWGDTGYHTEQQYWFDWKNVTSQMSHISFNGNEYYIATNIPVKQNTTYHLKWEYNINAGSSGKWELIGKLSSDTIEEALSSGRYIMIDPWWDSNWLYYKVATINNPLDDYQVLLKLDNATGGGGDANCSGHANTNFSDIRFLRTDNATELSFWVENYTADTQAWIWVYNEYNDSTILMYYGNSNAANTTNGSNTFPYWFEDYENYSDGDIPGGWHFVDKDGMTFEVDDAQAYQGTKSYLMLEDGGVNTGLAYTYNFTGYDTGVAHMWLRQASERGGIYALNSSNVPLASTYYVTTQFDYRTKNNIGWIDTPNFIETDPLNTWHRIEYYINSSTDDSNYIKDRDNPSYASSNTSGWISTWDGNTVDTINAFRYNGNRLYVTSIWIDVLYLRNYTIGTEPSWATFGAEQSNPVPPEITINYAGNLSDFGGPYYRPPSTSVVLSGDFWEGYYTNSSRQKEDWIYINCTISSDTGVDEVWLHWYNESGGWVNNSYQFINPAGNYWEYNTSGNVLVSPGYNYSFDVWANDTDDLQNVSFWNKTGADASSFVRRYVQLNNTEVNMTYVPMYIYNASYSVGGSADTLYHDQGVVGTAADTGYFFNETPTDTISNRYCGGNWVTWYSDNTTIEPIALNNIYFHMWCSNVSGTGLDYDIYFNRSRQTPPAEFIPGTNDGAQLTLPDDGYSNITWTPMGAVTNPILTLVAGRIDRVNLVNYNFTDNNIFELSVSADSAQACVASNRSFTSFVLINVPDNASLDAYFNDSDNDLTTDRAELYTYHTNPFLQDTDNDSYNDTVEIAQGTDPNNYTDYPADLRVWQQTYTWNVSFSNTTNEQPIGPMLWNVSFSNTSTVEPIGPMLWNVSFSNTSTVEPIGPMLWNISFSNTTAQQPIGPMLWNVSFSNTSNEQQVFTWNVSFSNTTNEQPIGPMLWNVSFSNTSTRPIITFLSQVPPDLSVYNVIASPMNITYNITAADGLNKSTILLFYKNNKTGGDDTNYYLNGTAYRGYRNKSYTHDIDGNFSFILSDNEVYPATYNYNQSLLEDTIHASGTLNNQISYLSIELLNVSNSDNYSFFEIMVNNTGTQGIRIYYANESYDFNSPVATSPNAILFYTIPGNEPYNHTHPPGNSQHHVIPFAVNTTTGMLGDVYVTETSYFIVRGNSGTAAQKPDYYYIADQMRNTSMISTNNGITWANQTFTMDAHMHQYNGSDWFYYYVYAEDDTATSNTSALRSDLIDLGGLAPTVVVFTPVGGNYSGTINISYAALSPNNYAIANYSIELYNFTYHLIDEINTSLTETFFNWDSRHITPGNYTIRVAAYDTLGQIGYGYSEFFNITLNYTQTYTWNISFSNTTAQQPIGPMLWNVSFSNTSNEQQVFTWNVSFSNSTSELPIGPMLWNVSFSNTSNEQQTFTWNVSFSNTTTGFEQVFTWNVSFSNTSEIAQRFTWNVSFSNSTLQTIFITRENPNNTSAIIIPQPILYWRLNQSDGDPMNYSIYLGNSTANATYLVDMINVTYNGTYNYDNYSNATVLYESYYWRVAVHCSAANEWENETFYFNLTSEGGGYRPRNIGVMAAFGLLCGCGSLIFLLFLKREKNKKKRNNYQYGREEDEYGEYRY